ncbi:MAG: alpha/beta hydrolase [Alphaproteobacteria bacterium CG11_big_fil_rev_8_21_14_0_20_44_7]|nr:MAG: alpha/beta hydrolase [Alphaproteobacteria bacterium CG11_big_fil_rev_8_21_14_0_20_44_7]
MAEIFFNGPEGRLEGRYNQSADPTAPIALVLHPHPLYGGTMNNKVVYNLHHNFASNGFSVLRMNFRGVGRSQGKYDNGIGELADAASALDWIQLQNPDARGCWIVGFSFGAWISLQLMMRRPEIEGFVCVSPPANMYDFSFLSPCPASGLVTQGDLDSVVPEEVVARLAEKLNKQRGVDIDYKLIGGADHYYRTKLDELMEEVDSYVKDRLANAVYKRPTKPDRKRRSKAAIAAEEMDDESVVA